MERYEARVFEVSRSVAGAVKELPKLEVRERDTDRAKDALRRRLHDAGRVVRSIALTPGADGKPALAAYVWESDGKQRR